MTNHQTDVAGLVERLRAQAALVALVAHGNLMDEAAASLTTLSSEVERLKGERDDWKSLAEGRGNACYRMLEAQRQSAFAFAVLAACAEHEIESLNMELDGMEFDRCQVERALTDDDEPDEYAPTVLGRAKDIMRAFHQNREICASSGARALSAEALAETLRGRVGEMEAAGRDLLAGMTSTFKARNGRDVGVQGDDGEKVWLVHSDLIAGLQRAIQADEGEAG